MPIIERKNRRRYTRQESKMVDAFIKANVDSQSYSAIAAILKVTPSSVIQRSRDMGNGPRSSDARRQMIKQGATGEAPDVIWDVEYEFNGETHKVNIKEELNVGGV